MVDYREILRLHNLGYSQRVITSSVHSSRSTVKEVIDLFPLSLAYLLIFQLHLMRFPFQAPPTYLLSNNVTNQDIVVKNIPTTKYVLS